MPLTHTKTFQRMYLIGTYLLINPNWDFNNNEPKNLSLLYKTCFLLIQAMSYCYGYCEDIYFILSSFNEIPYKSSVILHLIDSILSISVTCCLFWLGNDRKWSKIIDLLSRNDQEQKGSRFFSILLARYIFVTHLPIIIVIFVMSYHMIFREQSVSIVLLLGTISGILSTYVYNGFIAVLCSMLVAIREQLKLIFIEIQNQRYEQTQHSLKKYQASYRKSLEICETFNDLFGNVILLIIFMFVSKLLCFINALIVEEVTYRTVATVVFSGVIVMVRML